MTTLPRFVLNLRRHERRPGGRSRRSLVVLWVVVIAIAVAVGALWSYRQGAERRAIARLPAAERGEVYRRELDAFRTLCGQGRRRDELQGQCRERASFILEFPECDPGCQQLVRSHLDVPRR
jgi:hypothetical protein